jgi:hypothetical protein
MLVEILADGTRHLRRTLPADTVAHVGGRAIMVDNDRVPESKVPQHVEEWAKRFEEHAVSRRRSAQRFLLMVALTVLTGIAVFLTAGWLASVEEHESHSRIEGALAYVKIALDGKTNAAEREILMSEGMKTILSLQTPGSSAAWSTIATRTGSIVLFGFLIQILTTAYRYHMRLSEAWLGRACALRIASAGLADLSVAGELMRSEPMEDPEKLGRTAGGAHQGLEFLK